MVCMVVAHVPTTGTTNTTVGKSGAAKMHHGIMG